MMVRRPSLERYHGQTLRLRDPSRLGSSPHPPTAFNDIITLPNGLQT
ncbi:unnamed protein product [Tetraodon nigroviridis]|uniref:(spotted green pufferfish) hypothetical protein n=1 Tax=Tetraodon nigroviridis TaxID=99883 RepID=Q4SAE0_TETNG|nr:unnamed protein product [Tetraodon nigroviridis]